MLHAPSSHLGLWTTAPEQIDAPGPRNGIAGVVVEHKTRCWPPGDNLTLRIQHWPLYLDERQSTWREEALICRYGTARHEDQAEIAPRALDHRTKKDVAWIAVQDALRHLRVPMSLLGMGAIYWRRP